MSKNKKLFFYSLGCPRNRVDSEVMLKKLSDVGFETCDELQEADLIVVNTCGFLASARNESIATLSNAIKNKKNGSKVIACGCMVGRFLPLLKEKCPEIDFFIGPGDVDKIVEAAKASEKGQIIGANCSFLDHGERLLSTPAHYAYLKIAEGCSKHCSFCIIPLIKGTLRSKSAQAIIEEVSNLLDKGVQEIIFVAQDLGDWGKDLGYKKAGLAILLKALLKQEKRSFWLRLLYLYPDEIDSELLSLMKDDARICHYIDMPLQHVADPILQAMGRKTNKKQIVETIEKIRKELPDVVLRTSFIVGFPGEQTSHFNELKEFLQSCPIEQVGFFTYSPEVGSLAAKMDNQVDEATKQKRLKSLVKIQQKIVDRYTKSMVGKKLEAFIDGFHPETDLLLRGHFKGQCPEIDGQIIINDKRGVDAFGKLYQIIITDRAGYDLVGHVST